MAYPDTTNNLSPITDRGPGEAGTKWEAATVNPWVAEVNAITTELGADPKGAYTDVASRLDAIEGLAGADYIPPVSPARRGFECRLHGQRGLQCPVQKEQLKRDDGL